MIFYNKKNTNQNYLMKHTKLLTIENTLIFNSKF